MPVAPLCPDPESALPDPGGSPWLWLLGSVREAGDARALVLAAVGLLLTRGGHAVLDLALGRPAGDPEWLPIGMAWPIGGDGGIASRLAMGAWAIAEPMRVVVGPMIGVFSVDRGLAAIARDGMAGFWGLLVWGVIGGSIARLAAVKEGGRGEGIGLRTALHFLLRRSGSLVAAPLCPLLAAAMLAVPGALIGLLYAGGNGLMDAVAGALLWLPLLLAVLMAMLLIGLALGWPLMVLTIAVEGEDGFEAVSRSYSYLSRRPMHYAAWVLLAWVAGAVGFVLASWFVRLVVHLACWALAVGGPDDRLARGLALPAVFASGAETLPMAVFWMRLVGLVLSAWAFSFSWSAFARIYLLLREEVDGTPRQDIDRPGADAEPITPGLPAAGTRSDPPPGTGPEGA